MVNLAPEDWLAAADVAALAHSRVVELPRRLIVAGAELGRRLGLSPFGADRAVLISGPLALSSCQGDQLTGVEGHENLGRTYSPPRWRSDWHRSPRNRQI